MRKGRFLDRVRNALISRRTERLGQIMDVGSHSRRHPKNDMLDPQDPHEAAILYTRQVQIPELKEKARERRSFKHAAPRHPLIWED